MEKILRPQAIGPPGLGVSDAQLRKVLWRERDVARFARSEFHRLLETHIFDLALHNRADRLIRGILDFRRDSEFSFVERCICEMRGDHWMAESNGPARGNINVAPESHIFV